MKTNEGGLDRTLRILVGLVLVALTLSGTIGVWGWIGVVPIVTGALGWCPAYTLLGRAVPAPPCRASRPPVRGPASAAGRRPPAPAAPARGP